mgnify:CR=1 FL=1
MPEESEKLWRVNDSCVAALTGTVWWLEAAQAWTLLSFATPDAAEVTPPRLKDATLVLFWPARIVEYGDDGMSMVVKTTHGYYAWGSGSDVAFGALAMGADAVEAVRVAALFDQATGGTIRSMAISQEALHDD